MFEKVTGSWSDRAKCKGNTSITFYPGRGESVQPQKDICRGCPVVKPCLEFALRNYEKFGVWGATSERERRKMRSARSRFEKNGRAVTTTELLKMYGVVISNLRESELDSFSGKDGYE